MFKLFRISITVTAVLACAAVTVCADDEPAVSTESVAPGGMVRIKDASVQLYGTPVKLGDDFLKIAADAGIDFPFKNKVTLVSIVPSLDTPVCEFQTYKLSTMDIPDGIDVITVSRDLPMAQARFARDHDMSPAEFVSDYKTGAFGKSTGLMMKDHELLARGLLVLDADGAVQYFQIVPQVSQLPDIDHALAKALEMVASGAE